MQPGSTPDSPLLVRFPRHQGAEGAVAPASDCQHLDPLLLPSATMTSTGWRKLLPLILLSLSILSLFCSGLAARKTFGPSNGSWVWLGCGLGGMVGLVAAWCWWRNLLQEQRFFQYLEQLADWAQESTFATDCVLEKQSLLSNRWTFFPVVARLKEAIGRLRGRLEHLEDVRAGLEVRMRRVQSEGQQIYTILTGIPEPLLAINEYGELLWANPSAEALLQGEASGKRALVAERIGCPQLVALLQHMLLRKTATSRSEEIEWIDPQGKTHFYRVMVTRLAAGRDPPDPGQVSLIAVFRDIADQKALQKRHAEFVSSVSHEMKTPLAGIKAYVELLADGDVDDPATQQEFFQTIAAQVDRLQRLVENLLNLARIEAGIVEVRKHPHSLNEILEEAFRVVQPAAQAKQIRLETDLSELYLNVYIDRDLLLQAAINLLSNAVKYTPSGGRVVLRSRLEEPYAQFEVEDTGVGLSPEDCQRVFEKFYRVQKDAHMASGTGLGLPLAKHIVEDVHGGTITVQSQLGVGSTFRVRLPLLGRTWDSRGPVSEMSEPASVGAPG